jgi:hypothetical protein
MLGSHIYCQNRCLEPAERLKEVIASDILNLLIGLPAKPREGKYAIGTSSSLLEVSQTPF